MSDTSPPLHAAPIGAFALLLLSTCDWISDRTERVQFVDVVTIERLQRLELRRPAWGPTTAVPTPLLWIRKESTVSTPAGEFSPFLTTRGREAAAALEMRSNFADFQVVDEEGRRLRISTREATDDLVTTALAEIVETCYLEKLDRPATERGSTPNRVVTTGARATLRSELGRVVAAGVQPALDVVARYFSATGDRPSEQLATVCGVPIVSALLLESVLGFPLVVDVDWRTDAWTFTVSYSTTHLWQTRTLKASIGVEPTGLELEVPRIGWSGNYTLECVKPDGCEILGTEIRTDSEAADLDPLYVRKAPRRSGWQLLREKLATRNLVFRSQDRTRFGRTTAVRHGGGKRFDHGAATVWLSFERRSIRPAILGVASIFSILLFLVAWVQAIGGPGHTGNGWLSGWHWYELHATGRVSLARYATIVGPSSSAVVTALVAPGALVSFLSRQTEHEVLSQLLRMIRFMVLIAAAELFLGSLLVAVNAPVALFATWLTWSVAIVAGALMLLAAAYRNCERLPARPGVFARWLIRRHDSKRQAAVDWLTNNPPMGQGESESWGRRRRRRLATALVWQGEATVNEAGRTPAECLANARLVVDRLVRPGERTTKEPRRMPFADPAKAVFTVRLNRIENIEPTSVVARLEGLDEQRRVLVERATAWG